MGLSKSFLIEFQEDLFNSASRNGEAGDLSELEIVESKFWLYL
jgi:hypothetical protein